MTRLLKIITISAICAGLVFGQISSIPSASGTGGAPSGAAGGSLAGIYPNPTLAYTVTNPQTGTTYALVTGDRDKLVTLTNANAIAVSIAQAGSTGFPDGWSTTVLNSGVGTATITPATSTIEGAATLVLTTGQAARIWSDGTNYRAARLGKVAAATLADTVTNGVTAAANIGDTKLVVGSGGAKGVAESASTFGVVKLTAGVPSAAASTDLSDTADLVRKSAAKNITLITTGSGTSGVLVDGDDQPAFWYNSLGGGITITGVSCKTDSATATRIQLQRDDGSAADILTDNAGAGLDCSSTRAAGTLSGTEKLIASTNAIDFVVVTAGGAGKWVVVTITYTVD